jgi:hypothetical protein
MGAAEGVRRPWLSPGSLGPLGVVAGVADGTDGGREGEGYQSGLGR